MKVPWKRNRLFIQVTIGIVAFLFLYWCKTQMGLQLFDRFSLSKFPPFAQLQPRKYLHPFKPNEVIRYQFDHFWNVKWQGGLWAREPGRVHFRRALGGPDGSGCLEICSESRQSWSFSQFPFLPVEQGQRYALRAMVLQQGKGRVYLGFSAFDDQNRVVDWNYLRAVVSNKGQWYTLKDTVLVGPGVCFLRFRLSGRGETMVRVDQVELKRLP